MLTVAEQLVRVLQGSPHEAGSGGPVPSERVSACEGLGPKVPRDGPRSATAVRARGREDRGAQG